jgi:hypothetical protein
VTSELPFNALETVECEIFSFLAISMIVTGMGWGTFAHVCIFSLTGLEAKVNPFLKVILHTF